MVAMVTAHATFLDQPYRADKAGGYFSSLQPWYKDLSRGVHVCDSQAQHRKLSACAIVTQQI